MEEEEGEGAQPQGGVSNGGERLKRDEWSEGAVTCLLEAYEAKWVLRNRAKLKGQDWEDVAREVSSRMMAKTATQCKNKIESMKKRYRNEVAAGSGSRWPLFARIDGLVRCRGSSSSSSAMMVAEDKPTAGCTAEANGVMVVAAAVATVAQAPDDNAEGEKSQRTEHRDKSEEERNTPSCGSSEEKREALDMKRLKKRKKRAEEVVESIQLLTDVILRTEQTRMETLREIEKIRAETEARKGEMELKRTEIIANTQLQIARLFARSNKVVSEPRIERD